MNDEAPIEPGPLVGPPVPPRVLNPAHAILVGAVLSAIVTLVGVTLNIRSSERLSSERDKRDAAVAEANTLKDEVGNLEKRLDDALAKIPTATADTSATATNPPTITLAPPPQSIVVIVTIPAQVSAAPAMTSAPLTTLAPKPTALPTVQAPSTTGVLNPTAAATSAASSTTTSTSTTTTIV